MPVIKDRIDLSETEKSIFDALLQANKQVGSRDAQGAPPCCSYGLAALHRPPGCHAAPAAAIPRRTGSRSLRERGGGGLGLAARGLLTPPKSCPWRVEPHMLA